MQPGWPEFSASFFLFPTNLAKEGDIETLERYTGYFI
jgi:hypothetical protein